MSINNDLNKLCKIGFVSEELKDDYLDRLHAVLKDKENNQLERIKQLQKEREDKDLPDITFNCVAV